jgi:uncharacterized protein (TIGR03437 family)
MSHPQHLGFWLITSLLNLVLAGPLPLIAQQPTEQQFIASVNTAIGNLVATLGTPTHPIVFGGQVVAAYGTRLYNEDLSVILDYIDGLKAAGVQRIEFNPGVYTLTNASNVAKYDAIVWHIRELGLDLAINPEYETGEPAVSSFAQFQTQALATYQELASRYQPDNFVIVHEPDTMAGRMGITTGITDWHNFILAAAPVIKAASPHTRVGAGCVYNTVLSDYNHENSYFADFVTIPALDFMTMDIYSTDFSQFSQWAQLAQQNGKGVYIEEVWAPHDVPVPLPANTGESLDELSIVGPANADFMAMDINWLHGMALFASANNMEAMTPFTTETFFLYGPAGSDKPDETSYWDADETAIQQGLLTATAQGYLADSQQMGIRRAVTVSAASYATLPTVFDPTCGTGSNPCNALSVVAPDSLASAFGADLGTSYVFDGSFPVSLGGTTMTLVDSSNTSYPVQMYFVAPGQVNYYVPDQAQLGPASITITSGDGTVTTGTVMVAPVMPGLFTANTSGTGPVSAIAICAGVCAGWPNQQADGQAYQDTFTCSAASCAPVPLTMAPGDTVVLELFGTGIRHLASASALTVEINGQNVPYQYAGAQGDTGLDQINVQLPPSLAGIGQVNLVLIVQDTVDNVTLSSNTVTLNIQ